MLLAACTLTQGMDLPPTTVTPHPTLPPSTLVSTRVREVHEVATSTPPPSPTIPLYICDNLNAPSIPNYAATAELNYAKHTLKVAQSIAYTNLTAVPLNILVLNVKPNTQPGIFKLESMNLGDSSQPKSHLLGQKLEITLPQPLNPNCTVTIKLNYTLHIPPIDVGGLNAYQGYLGYSQRQTNLGLWLPVIAAHDGRDWVTHEESPIGEQDAFEIANWDVHLTLKNAPKTIQVAAPGVVERINDTDWHFTLSNARDFSLSLGENYRLLQQTTTSGVTIELYSFADALLTDTTSSLDSAAFSLNIAVKSVNLYESLYGTYPLKRLVIVEGDFPDGMEFSGLVFVGGEYFRGLSGVESYLTIISAHEVAHQWWYAQVGNDQALNPWLDESLATYSEYVFIEKYYPELKDWWWNFRVNRLAPQGYVDSTVYEFSSRRAYINAIYLRGVQMLHDIRTELGDDVFFGWLNRYAATDTGRIAAPIDFWSLLTPDQLSRTDPIRQRYLRQPQITTPTPLPQ